MSNNQQSRDNARFGSGMRGRLGETGWTRTRAVLSLGMVLGLGAVGTMAAWSDSATATTGMFSTSSVQMKVNNQRSAFAFTALTAPGLMPLGSTAAVLAVQNTGTVAFNYTAMVKASGDAGMAGFLTITAVKDGTVSSGKCTGGSILGSTIMQVGTAKPLIAAAQNIAAGGASNVCFQAELSGGVTKATNGKSAQAIIEFTAQES